MVLIDNIHKVMYMGKLAVVSNYWWSAGTSDVVILAIPSVVIS